MSARRPVGWAVAGYGVTWLVVAGLVAVVVRLQTPNPAELLVDVADRPVVWLVMNVVLIAQQLAMAEVVVAACSVTDDDRWRRLIGTCGAIAAGSLIVSGVVHGVFGAHLAGRLDGRVPTPDEVRLAEVTHALGDTTWFVGVGALMLLTAVTCERGWRSGRLSRSTVRLGALGVIANAAQFGWFVDHRFAVFGAAGTVLQAGWLVALGRGVGRSGSNGGAGTRPAASSPS
ncbi:MAG: hypothetical protein ACK5OX_14035 [Desertimonas sp.]